MPTLEGSYDAEEVEDDKLEGTGSKGKEDQGPGKTEDQAEAQQSQHVGPLLVVWAKSQDLHHHGDQHGQVEQEHQAEEAQVGDIANQRVPDPAPGREWAAQQGEAQLRSGSSSRILSGAGLSVGTAYHSQTPLPCCLCTVFKVNLFLKNISFFKLCV